jgi:vanillate O-demethylase monooxygenase subunit
VTATDTSLDPHDSHLDVSGEALLYEALHEFWHPVAYASVLAEGGPIPALLLDEPLVVARLDGEVRVFRDLCSHRGTAISLGWVEDNQIRCPYHGWAFGPDGMCTEIPARFGTRIPDRARLKSYRAKEAGGLIWVCLGKEPRMPVPDFGDHANPDFRIVEVPPYDWQSAAARRLENYVDFAHFAWVHDGLLGDRSQPEVPDHEVRRVEAELQFGEGESYGELPETETPGRSKSQDGLPHKSGTIVADKTYRLSMPFTVWLKQRLPGGQHYQLFFSAAPTSPKTCRSFTFMARDYDLDPANDEKFLSFNDVVIGQDQPLVQSQRPEELPVDLSAEVQIRGVDKVAVEYRRWLKEIAYA